MPDLKKEGEVVNGSHVKKDIIKTPMRNKKKVAIKYWNVELFFILYS
jgi:hypothetical protein